MKIIIMKYFIIFQRSYDNDEQRLEDDQDFMGLYELELSKQLYLRNKQKREWDMMNKQMKINEELKKQELSSQQAILEQEKKDEDRTEKSETDASRKLTAAMVQSYQKGDHDTLTKVVEVLRDQSGNIFFRTI